MPQVIQSRQAKIDLVEIGLYIARDNPAAAERLVETIESKFQMLAHTPEVGQFHPELLPDLRCFTVRKYVIYYREISNGIEVVRVLHGARDAGSLFRGS